MKSLRDEIRTDVRDKEDGFNFICRYSDRFHPGFARISSQHRRDFIKKEEVVLWLKINSLIFQPNLRFRF